MAAYISWRERDIVNPLERLEAGADCHEQQHVYDECVLPMGRVLHREAIAMQVPGWLSASTEHSLSGTAGGTFDDKNACQHASDGGDARGMLVRHHTGGTLQDHMLWWALP